MALTVTQKQDGSEPEDCQHGEQEAVGERCSVNSSLFLGENLPINFRLLTMQVLHSKISIRSVKERMCIF